MNIFNKKGMSIIECLVAVLLTTTGIISLMTMQSVALQGSGKSDYLGRASGILQRELEMREIQIMRGPPPAGPFPIITCADQNGNTVSCSAAGVMFTITYTMTKPSTWWLINVKLTWPGSSVNGISSSMAVARQQAFD